MVRSSAVNIARQTRTVRHCAPCLGLHLPLMVAVWLLASLVAPAVFSAEFSASSPGERVRQGVENVFQALPDLQTPEQLFDPPPLVVTPSERQAETTCSLWLISSRAAGCSVDLADLDLYEFTPKLGWTARSLQDFHAEGSASVPTVFFVHGNRYTANDALQTGETLFDRLSSQSSADQPVRFVIWSWPSSEIDGGQVKDLRVKANRAEWQGVLLAKFVAAMNPNVRVSLVGHSYGSRLISSSLHVLGGGVIAGRGLDEPLERNQPLRAVLLAAAMGSQWLLPGNRHGQAMNSVDGLLVMANSSDNVLRWYPRLFPGKGPEALGYTGIMAPGRLGPHYKKVQQVDVSPLIGKAHNLADYFHTPAIWQRFSKYALFATEN